MTVRELKISGVFVRGFKAAAYKIGIGEKLRSQLTGDVAAMWDKPESASWHPGELFQQLTDVTKDVMTNEEMVEMNFAMANDQFGPIVAGMVRIAVALSSPSPHTVMKNIRPMVALANRGLEIDYTVLSANSGKLHINYPVPFPPITVYAWVGVVRFAVGLVNQIANIEKTHVSPDGFDFELQFNW